MTFTELLAAVRRAFEDDKPLYDRASRTRQRPTTIWFCSAVIVRREITDLERALAMAGEIARLGLPLPPSSSLEDFGEGTDTDWLEFYRRLIDGVVCRSLGSDPALLALQDQRHEPVRRRVRATVNEMAAKGSKGFFPGR